MTKNERIDNLKQLLRYSTTATLYIPKKILDGSCINCEKTIQAYEELKKDPNLKVLENTVVIREDYEEIAIHIIIKEE